MHCVDAPPSGNPVNLVEKRGVPRECFGVGNVGPDAMKFPRPDDKLPGAVEHLPVGHVFGPKYGECKNPHKGLTFSGNNRV